MIHTAEEPEVKVKEPEGESSETYRPQRIDFPKSKGVQIFTIEYMPSEQWESKFQEFHA